jgi:enoyl-CoA hydratase/carnithine racemase
MGQSIIENNDQFRYDIEEGIAIISLYRDAFEIVTNLEASKLYIEALKAIDRDPKISGVVQVHDSTFEDTAALECFFATLKGQVDQSTTQITGLLERYGNLSSKLVNLLKNFTKPLVAGIDGEISLEYLGMTLPFDLRIATNETKTVFSNLKMGFPPSGHLGYSLSRFVGPGRAKELFVSGRSLSAKDLYDLGLVTKVTTKEELLSQCLAMSKDFSGPATLGLKATRQLMQQDDDERQRFSANARDVFIKTMATHLKNVKG